jgi:hypothetical protein
LNVSVIDQNDDSRARKNIERSPVERSFEMSSNGNNANSSESCSVCGFEFQGDSTLEHYKKCANQMLSLWKESNDPFQHWKISIALDHANRFDEAEDEFRKSASLFFNLGAIQPDVGRAMYEYSTLMDGFSKSEAARRCLNKENFDKAASNLTSAAEIFRSTIHFGFLAPYVSSCATLDTAAKMPKGEDDTLQAYKNANALLEQSKLSLSFRDESHPLVRVMEAYLKFSISGALFSEATAARVSGDNDLGAAKEKRATQVRQEYKYLAKSTNMPLDIIEYFPLRDFNRRESQPFIVGFPEREDLLLLNIGECPATVHKVGNLEMDKKVEPQSSASVELKLLTKGKIRIQYVDQNSTKIYDEGCITLL